jgi:hypothetical protein
MNGKVAIIYLDWHNNRKTLYDVICTCPIKKICDLDSIKDEYDTSNDYSEQHLKHNGFIFLNDKDLVAILINHPHYKAPQYKNFRKNIIKHRKDKLLKINHIANYGQK